jgi:hypothetical protein
MQVTYSNKQDPVKMMIGVYTADMVTMHPVQNADESGQAFNKRVQYGRGMYEAYANSFAVIIATVRIQRYGARLDSIPSPAGFEIGADLLPAIDAGWDEAKDKRGGKNAVRDVAAFYEALEPFLQDYIYPENLEEQYEVARRKSILDGLEKPEPGDEEWLKLKAEELENRAAQLRSMVE